MLARMFSNFLVEEDGQDLVEYTLLAAFIAFAALSLMPNMSDSLARWTNVSQTAIRVSSAVFAVVVVVGIVLRRKRKEEDEY